MLRSCNKVPIDSTAIDNISDIYYNASYEAEGPFECIYVKTLIDLCCCEVYFIRDSVYSHNS